MSRAMLPRTETGRWALGIGIGVFLVYNANGREIGTVDSQAAKLVTREVVLRRTLVLDEAVRARRPLARRSGLAIARDGHYRNAYPMVPALLASGVARLLAGAGLVDMRAPLAPNLVATLTASALVAGAVVLAFLTARRRSPPRSAALVALGFGLGTNLWAAASQTLWQHETALFGLTAAVLCLAPGAQPLSGRRLWIAAAALGLAGAARPQLAPAIAVLALSMLVRAPRLGTLAALAPLAAGMTEIRRSRPAVILAWTALAWSVLVAGTGAFCYPHDRWNTHRRDVDRYRRRLWVWKDPQVVRCWRSGPSPQNFNLFSRRAVRSG